MMKLATGQPMPRIIPPMLSSCAFGGCVFAGGCACAAVVSAGRRVFLRRRRRQRTSVKTAANKAVRSLRFNSQAARNVFSTSKSLCTVVTRKPGRARATRSRRPGLTRRDRARRAPLLIPAARARSPPTFLFDGRAGRREQLGALVERRLAHVVHLPIDLGTRGVQFLIVFGGGGGRLLRRGFGQLSRAANGGRCARR